MDESPAQASIEPPASDSDVGRLRERPMEFTNMNLEARDGGITIGGNVVKSIVINGNQTNYGDIKITG
jgi:hypothetical protein